MMEMIKFLFVCSAFAELGFYFEIDKQINRVGF